VIREDNKSKAQASYRIGNVTSIEPFMVDVAGTAQDRDSFLRNKEIETLEIGDTLFLVPIENEQKYIIVCKVVNM